MRLSEAIRLGAMLKPQAFHGASNKPESCAMTAACEAAGVSAHTVSAYMDQWTWLTAYERCPSCGKEAHTSYVITCCLNDRHHWTRERIASWVESIEPVETSAPISPACKAMEECHEAVG